MPGIGASENHNDPDSILVDILNCVWWIHDETIFFLYRYKASFDVEVSKEVQMEVILMKKIEVTSTYLANFSRATWAFEPKTMLGWK